jgi:hypothetical protein
MTTSQRASHTSSNSSLEAAEAAPPPRTERQGDVNTPLAIAQTRGNNARWVLLVFV